MIERAPDDHITWAEFRKEVLLSLPQTLADLGFGTLLGVMAGFATVIWVIEKFPV